MRTKGQREKLRQIKKLNRTKYLISFLAIGLIIYLLSILIGQQAKINQLRDIQEEQVVSEQKLDQEIEKLSKEKADSNNPEIIEKIAREKLGMIEPDEIIVKDLSQKSRQGVIQPSLGD
ncbi:MAG: cell division protein FtsL [Finegoldia sp.]|nr:cell division protein FtsL [Finegoldia sp.]